MRLYVITEGQTEENFVNIAMEPYLRKYGIFTRATSVITKIDKCKGKSYHGGVINYSNLRKYIKGLLKNDKNNDIRLTSMIDFYGFPKDFPSFSKINEIRDPYSKIAALEESFAQDINDWRFIPYVQLHEFEALILAGIEKLQELYAVDETKLRKFTEEVRKTGPELINDGPKTAPSKRLKSYFPSYSKLSASSYIAANMQLAELMECCPHFGQWIEHLKTLAGEQ